MSRSSRSHARDPRLRRGAGAAFAAWARGSAGPLRRAASRARTRGRSLWRKLSPGVRRGILVAALALVALAGGVIWGTWSHICRDCPSIAQIYAFDPKEATRVYAADGSLLAEFALERRTVVPYDSLPGYVPSAFVAVEDRRFWEHGGVDLLRTVRAFFAFLIQGYEAQGGSTITQQLAGNMFSESVNRQVLSVERKLKEMRVALDLEEVYSKREILQAYMNQINFGDGRYGIESAAHYYFDKSAEELNLPEAALLAALPRAPALYSPIRHPERALRRRNLVLELMAGQGMITPAQAAAASAYPVAVHRGRRATSPAPYFVEWVRRRLMDRYGMELYEAGLRVYTPLDRDLQAVADSALDAQLAWIEEQGGFRAPTYEETRSWPEEELEGSRMPYVQGAFVALDPETGDVLALVGGRDYQDSEFNRVTQARRQPGSVFKPFVYTAALASGIPPSEIIYDAPTEILLPDSTVYTPKNFGDRFHGPVTVREALYRSINVVAVKVGMQVGLPSVVEYAHRLGIATYVPAVPSVSIGSASVLPLQVAEAYTTFANVGSRVRARPILRVENSDGRVLWESPVEREPVLETPVAWLALDLLRDVVDSPRGTGAVVRALGLPREVPAAGKTGTTNEATNAWFVGFTPDILTTTWVGFDEPMRIRTNAQGGVDAAPIGARVLLAYYRNHGAPDGAWPRPDEILSREVDRSSGMLATPWCPQDSVYVEYFLPGTEPTRGCTLHGPWEGRMVPDTLLDAEDGVAPEPRR